MYTLQVKNLDLISNFDLLYFNDIYIYGAADKGKWAKNQLSKIGLDIMGFCDGDRDKWNVELEGKTIISPMELKKRADIEEIIILVASSAEDSIVRTLSETNVKCEHVYTLWGLKYAIHMNLNNIRIPEDYRVFYWNGFKLKKYIAVNMIRNGKANFLKSFYNSSEVPIWICQPGKTASSSLSSIFNMHGISNIKNHDVVYPFHIFQGQLEKEWSFFGQDIRKKRMKIITAVREPIARDYSAFWQAFTDDECGGSKGLYAGVAEHNFQDAYYRFIDLIMNGYKQTKNILGVFTPFVWRDQFLWFDEEIKGGLGIDIYQYPFKKEEGYGIIEQGNKEILILKVEQIKKNLDVLSQFVGKERLQMKQENLYEKKSLHWAYDELKEKIKVPDKYLDYYYSNNSKMDHFYTREEKKIFLNKG